MTKMKAKITAAFKMISRFIMDNLPEKKNIPLMTIAVIGFVCWGYWGFPEAKLVIIAVIITCMANRLFLFIYHVLGSIAQAKFFIETYPIIDAIDDGKLDPETMDDLDEDELEKILSEYK